jgi:hypothetical protein
MLAVLSYLLPKPLSGNEYLSPKGERLTVKTILTTTRGVFVAVSGRGLNSYNIPLVKFTLRYGRVISDRTV